MTTLRLLAAAACTLSASVTLAQTEPAGLGALTESVDRIESRKAEADAAYGSVPRAVPGITHCDRNLFAGDTSALYRYWGVGTGRA